MQKITVIKFSPYFPPHKWGLESHIQERSQRRIKKEYGEVINVTTPMGQDLSHETKEIYYKNHIIWYHKDWYQIIMLDAFNLIPVFPFPRFWTRKFWITIHYLRSQINQYGKKNIVINTHTRFFLTSLVGWIFAKCTWTKRIHIVWIL